VDFDGKVRGPTTYWDSAFEPEDGISERQWEERVEAAVAESVATHLIADVPFGLLLSGGVDSTSVAFHTNRIVGRPVKAFSVGFAEQEYSELTYAEQAARRCDLELHTELVGDDCLEVLPDLVTHYGEPFGDSSCIPTWYVSRLARSHVPMVLAGDGGDEAFGGYDSYGLWMGAQPRRQVWGLMQSSPRAALAWIAERARRSLAGRDRRRLADWQDNVAFMSEPDRRSLWRPEYHRHIGEWSDSFETAAARAYRWDRLAYAQYVDYQTYLPGDILTKVDVAAMYHGLEVRMPFVDVKVVEVARRLPLPQRCRWNDSVFVGKYVLKKILERTFPREFVYRPKQGFVGPVSTWLGGKRGRQMLEEVLGPPDGLAHEWFHPQAIRGYLAGQGSWNAEILWLLLVLGLWRRANRDVRFE
jgi:asparagine synthase (glutamine-hydrolysing)